MENCKDDNIADKLFRSNWKQGKLSLCKKHLYDIANIIENLNPNKAHGFDMISIRMLKICGDSILKPLELIFKSCIESGKFPIEWKKANVVPVHKKITNS